ncbi:NrpR regulatory domain-containing protein [Archaeoglobus sp.]
MSISVNERLPRLILQVLSEKEKPLTSLQIKNELEKLGIEVSDSAIRYHLKYLEMLNLTKTLGRKGRIITDAGRTYLDALNSQERLKHILNRIESNAAKITFDLKKREGTVMANVGLIPVKYKDKAISIIKDIPLDKLPSEWIAIFENGNREIGLPIPNNTFALCNIGCTTFDALLIKVGCIVWPRGHGTIYMRCSQPVGYKDFISFDGCTADPPTLLIKADLTSYMSWVQDNEGLVLSVLREVPFDFLGKISEVITRMQDYGMLRVLKIGRKNEKVCGFDVAYGRVGIADLSGSNVFAALHESGIPLKYTSIATIIDFSAFEHVEDL